MALDPYLAAMPFDKLLGDKQSDPCANGSAGREESFKYSRQGFWGDSHSVIYDRQIDAGRRIFRVRHGYGEEAARRHRIDRVRDQIRDHLHHFPATKHDFSR
jgi:hypothetical protein